MPLLVPGIVFASAGLALSLLTVLGIARHPWYFRVMRYQEENRRLRLRHLGPLGRKIADDPIWELQRPLDELIELWVGAVLGPVFIAFGCWMIFAA